MSPTLASYLFSLYFIGALSTKSLRLYLNYSAFPAGVFAVLFPAFLLTDVILISGVWLLLRRKNGILSLLGFCVGSLISLVTFGAASSQLGFWYKTGGQIDWADASAFASSPDNRAVLLSESVAPMSFMAGIAIVAWFAKARVHKLVGSVVTAGDAHTRSGLRWTATKLGLKKNQPISETESALLPVREHDDLESDYDVTEKPPGRDGPTRGSRVTRFLALYYFLLAFTGLVAVGTVLDPYRPYSRVFTTLPLPLLAILAPDEEGGCHVSSSWPLPHLIERINWQSPKGDFKGWAPGTENDIIKKYKERVPDWLPEDPPSGFKRWTQDAKDRGFVSSNETEDACPDPLALDPFYNPANDPLKISNLDSPFLEQLQDTIESNNATIRHVAVVLMESMREELFPLQQGSDFHGLLMKSHDELDEDEANALFAQVSPYAERLTGKPGLWTFKNGTKIEVPTPEWTDNAKEGYGGVNIIGGLSTASISTKSLSSVYCGTWPMPVDMFEEAETESYQPCFPQVLEMLNRQKEDKNTTKFQDQQWYPAFFQAVTDGYDRQGEFDAQIGFKHMVTKATIKADAGNDKDLEEVNYFGFPETALKRYLREYINNVTTNNQRMFMGHFTSTTHHPWATPKWFETSEYMGAEHGLMQTHKDLNDFLNTIRFTDIWLGTLMEILEETGVADETLIVFVGDHGQAFKEDFSKTGTYENPHVSNFRVPIAFRHPKLPNVQHRVNATSVSILPTVLDLLINTGSLNDKDKAVASDLLHDYEGQSLVRPVTTEHKGRRAWNFGIVNPGGKHLTITSADTPYRLVLPVDKKTEYIFSDIGRDPLELDRTLEWSVKSLSNTVRQSHGDDAADWVLEAEQVGLWWGSERKRLWHYNPS